jgi:hypothetical protein
MPASLEGCFLLPCVLLCLGVESVPGRPARCELMFRQIVPVAWQDEALPWMVRGRPEGGVDGEATRV